MKIKDITSLVIDAKDSSEGQHDPWQDHINWKSIKNEGYNAIVIGNSAPIPFTKFGPVFEVDEALSSPCKVCGQPINECRCGEYQS